MYVPYDDYLEPPRPSPHARRRAALIWLAAGVVIAVGGFAAFTITPPSEPLPPVTPADVRSLGDPAALPHPYISFVVKKIVDPGAHRSGRGHRNRPWQAYYYLLPVEDRYIVATSDAPLRPGLIQGRLVRWDAPVNRGALQSIYSTMPAYRDKITAVQLDVGDYTDPPKERGVRGLFLLVALAGGVVMLIGLYKLARTVGESAPAAPVAESPRWSFQPPR